MHQLTINNVTYKVPSSWNELTQEQVLSLVDMYNKKYNLAEISVKLLMIITGIKVVFVQKYQASGEVFHFRHGKHNYIIDVRDIIYAASKLDFLFRTEEIKGQKVYSLDSKLNVNLLPEIRFGLFFKKTWHGPADTLTNILFAEFIHAETAFDKLGATLNEKYLDRLIGILYRPEGRMQIDSPRGDIREPFNDFLIDKHTKIAARIPENIKIAILLYYTGSRYAITKIFPEIFSGKGSKEDTFKSYMNLVEVLAGYDVTKKDSVRSAYLFDVLLTLNQSILRDKEREKILKKRAHV